MENNKKSILESLIFIFGKPIKFKKLAQISGIKEQEVKELLDALNKEYAKQDRGIQFLFKNDLVQMVSNPKYGEFVKKLVTEELQEDLSQAALETLSIAAYRGPITRAEIEEIRGVNCIYILRSLLIRGLVEKTKSSEDARKTVYEVSFDFLRHLGVGSIKNLPNYNDLRQKISSVQKLFPEKKEEIKKEDDTIKKSV
jgi:segregation and condensation protein B